MVIIILKSFKDIKADSALRLPGQLLFVSEDRAKELIERGWAKSLEDAEIEEKARLEEEAAKVAVEEEKAAAKKEIEVAKNDTKKTN